MNFEEIQKKNGGEHRDLMQSRQGKLGEEVMPLRRGLG